jgi:TIR domain/FHA domain
MRSASVHQDSPVGDLFVSYARADAAVVTHDIGILREAGLDSWYDEHLPAGVLWREELARRIEGCGAVLCFLSKQSVASQYCTAEWTFAADSRKPLICIYLEDVALTPGLSMSIGRHQGLIRYALEPAAYRDKLIDAARRALMPDTSSGPSTLFLPETLLLRHADRSAIVPAGFSELFSVGRGADCNLIIESAFISRRHGYFKALGGAFVYRDESRNGTILKTDTEEQLLHGESTTLPRVGRLVIGDVTIEFEYAKCS